MNFEEAEARFRQLQARVQRGEPISRAEYEEQVSQLAVQDGNGVLWEINPRTGKWMYFDGAEWISGTPPGHDTSVVIPMPGASLTPSTPPPSTVASTFQAPPPPIMPRTSASSNTPPAPEAVPPYKRVGQDRRVPAPRPPMNPPQASEKKPAAAKTGALGRREWIPLAIGAVVLLVCAILLFVGGNFAMTAFSPTKTPTRIAMPTSASSPVATPVRLPSPTPIPPTPAPVTAKINTDTPANVRNKPSTSGSTILVKLKKDTQITLIAAGPKDGTNTWYQINLPDNPTPGWIRSDTFQVVGGDINTVPPVGGAATATKAPAAPQSTATLTPIGAIPPTPKP
ncbi:MAG: SH3 domain-containing protein [Chloroflexi bacterium]|nr:SH3 domain-containing protein [Chloroflexota bacterium]